MDLLFLENFVRERSVEETVISEGLSRIPDVTSLPLSFVKQYSAKEQRTYSSPFSWTSEEDYNILKDGILMLKKAMLLDAQRHVWLLLGLAFYASWTLAKDDALNFLRMIVECYQKALDEDPSNEDHLCCLGFAKRVLLLMPIDIEIKRIQAMREFAVSVFPDTEPVEITMDWATMEKKLEWLGRQKCAIFRGWAKENKKMDIATINKKLEELRRQNCAIFEGWAKENKKMEQSNNVVQVGIIVAAVSAMAASLFKKS